MLHTKPLKIRIYFQKYAINNKCHSNHYEATAHLAFRKWKPPLLSISGFLSLAAISYAVT